ncbi:DNA alkylation repair protein [Specibacter cremeus]|uniref:DNA alkylation repair protein n=1 Tax=Specibacter cremeus TaxID=1629051 RepID=UPI001F0CC2D1|nr:DNA alkylation repair protein [Specibacter cremeus]
MDTDIDSGQRPAKPNRPLLEELLPRLCQVALPEKADGMAAYMKSSMPYLGVPVPLLRKTVRAAARTHPFAEVGQLRATVEALWRRATFREERYAAIMLTDSRLARGDMALLPFYREVIETGRWWDFVDAAAPRVGELLLAHRGAMEPVIRAWSTEEDLWLRRCAILAQLPAKAATDTGLLEDVIVPNLADREFFIRKAIGWALRHHARTDPDWVRDFVARHRDRLSPLSTREALKHLGP